MAKAKKLPSGKWRVQVFLGKDADGKQIRRSITAPTKKGSRAAGGTTRRTAKYNNEPYDGCTGYRQVH